ncbi:MAG: aminopeptidase P family protein [Gammaproteobacteria bacterium]|nr:MAG: aminopeptidase P family protein [Gammaproteobacteria bacterium]
MNTIAQRLTAIRELMAGAGYDALVIPRADEYLGEYIPTHNERLRWICGFTGSAGVVIVLRDKAAIFVDGRYTVQVRREVPGELFEYHHLIEEPHARWLTRELPAGARVACDPRLHSLRWYQDTGKTLASAQLELITDTDNLVDRCWLDRPAPRVRPALLLARQYTGESCSSKRERIAGAVAEQGCDAALIFAPDSVSWLLNIRGTDLPQLPVVQSFAMLRATGEVTLFVDLARIPEGFAGHVGEGVQVLPESDAAAALSTYQGQKILADRQTANAWTQLVLERGGATLVVGEDPVLIPKACKNSVELAGTRRAHIRDAVAEIRFLAWLDAEVSAGRLHDEAVLSDKLFSFREQGEHFHECSFDTISAAGANAAMCHYNHRNTVPSTLQMDTAYLLDSGGQYTDGTTDITRTVAIGDAGADIRRMFTLVLKGHIALDRARFPKGTTGTQLDVLARQFLWQAGFDYDHGTGHGVGVFLSVHEAPQRISKGPNGVALCPGMIVSNEPGYYRDGAFGMRCENLLVVREAQPGTDETPMLEFEAITLVPFDTRLLDVRLLSAAELAWLNAYHQHVAATIGPLLQGSAKGWLQQATRAVSA